MFVSRAGQKLDHAMAAFAIGVTGKVCADLGANAGGFTDCLLQRGAARVYAVDTGYGVLDWKLRKDPRVVTMERTNAMHVELPEQAEFICIDVAWTRQKRILPAARRLLVPAGQVVTLIKPHYEASPPQLRRGVLLDDQFAGVIERVKQDISDAGFELMGLEMSPVKGAKGNVEMLGWLKLADGVVD